MSSEVVPSSSSVSLSDQDLNMQNQNGSDLQFNHGHFWELVQALQAVDSMKDQRISKLRVMFRRGPMSCCFPRILYA